MIVFRPLPGLTAATAAALALLVSLGFWQLDRAEQKRALIAERLEAQASAPVGGLRDAVCGAPADGAAGESAVDRAIVQPSPPARGGEVRFFGARTDGAPGWRLLRLTPEPDCACAGPPEACLRGDRSVIFEAGFETLSGERTGAPDLLAVEPPPRAGAFTPHNDPARGELYRFDPEDLARAFGVPLEEVESAWWLPAYAPGLPPALADFPPSRHVGYALTWFGLAGALLGVYLAFHHRAGRFRRAP